MGRKSITLPEGSVVNWTQNNKDIATSLGLKASTVAKLRKQAGAPPVPRGRPKRAVMGSMSTKNTIVVMGVDNPNESPPSVTLTFNP